MATIWASLNRPFFISQSSGSESYTFLYSQLALYWGKRTLTPRELEILHLIAKEHSNLDIANQLYISERTVETHRKNILTKTGCKSVVGPMQYALRHKLLTL